MTYKLRLDAKDEKSPVIGLETERKSRAEKDMKELKPYFPNIELINDPEGKVPVTAVVPV